MSKQNKKFSRITLAHVSLPAAQQSNKLTEQFKLSVEPACVESKDTYCEHDIYLCDRLVKELYGIQDLSLHINKIKEILKLKE